MKRQWTRPWFRRPGIASCPATSPCRRISNTGSEMNVRGIQAAAAIMITREQGLVADLRKRNEDKRARVLNGPKYWTNNGASPSQLAFGGSTEEGIGEVQYRIRVAGGCAVQGRLQQQKHIQA